MGTLPILDVTASDSTSNDDILIWQNFEHEFPDAVFRDVSFLNATYGWVVGQWTSGASGNGIILHTTDAGTTWQTQLQSPIDEHEFKYIEILDASSAWVTARGGLFRTINGGENWTEHSIVGGRLMMSTVEFKDSNHGWTATAETLYKTIDGGEIWTIVPGWTFDDTPRHIQFVSATEVWAIGFFGIYHSTDSAETWTEMYTRGGWSLSMQDDGEGWAVSDSTLMHTSDGTDWAEITVPRRTQFVGINPPYMTDVVFMDQQGWIVGTEIPVMYTPDGGTAWYEQSVPEEFYGRLYAVDFLNQTYGWAVGSGGKLLRTTNGNSLGSRLWNDNSNPVVLSIVGGIAAVVLISSGIFIRRRRSLQRIEVPLEIE